jgi:hypothetical protein
MKLFHISEEPNITEFIPRTPTRKDMDKSKGLVWALNERCLPNFLTPRDCPRVTYHAQEKTTAEDIAKFFSSTSRHAVAIEHGWYERMTKTTLYIYEFNPQNFYLQDQIAGYYVSEQVENPISVTKITNLFGELFKRNVEIRLLNNLWQLGEAVQKSTLNWSLCRMINAKPK